jgi:hypothetical protein
MIKPLDKFVIAGALGILITTWGDNQCDKPNSVNPDSNKIQIAGEVGNGYFGGDGGGNGIYISRDRNELGIDSLSSFNRGDGMGGFTGPGENGRFLGGGDGVGIGKYLGRDGSGV